MDIQIGVVYVYFFKAFQQTLLRSSPMCSLQWTAGRRAPGRQCRSAAVPQWQEASGFLPAWTNWTRSLRIISPFWSFTNHEREIQCNSLRSPDGDKKLSWKQQRLTSKAKPRQLNIQFLFSLRHYSASHSLEMSLSSFVRKKLNIFFRDLNICDRCVEK